MKQTAADTVRAIFSDEEVLAETFYREDEAPKPRLASLDGAGGSRRWSTKDIRRLRRSPKR